METPEWTTFASCGGKAHFLWYPPMEAKDPNLWYEMGRAVCATCPVWQPCLEAGQTEKWGMWGGLTPKERKRPSNTHGDWVSFRRGCRCGECWIAHDTQMKEEPIDPDLLPNKGDDEYTGPGRLLFDML